MSLLRIRERLGPPEILGPSECPVLHRWTLWESGPPEKPGGARSGGGRTGPKLLLHFFIPRSTDRDPHDHPRSFLTFVFAGGYDDLEYCGCMQPGAVRGGGPWLRCPECHGRGVIVKDRLRRGTIRFRRATYRHNTLTGSGGAWTLCLMGPKERDWGFMLRTGAWMPWTEYGDRFGFTRCE